MAIDTIKSTAVLDGAIATADIADDAVTSAKLDTNIAVDGDLTVDTSTLKVDSSNNRVGIGTASPGRKLELNNGGTGAFVTFTDGVATNFTFKTDGSNVGTFGTEAGSTHLGLMASGTERARIHSGGVMSVSNGIELGSGLDATAANVLDDYEEGTWTPAWANGSGQTYTQQMGTYVKIGRQVTITCFIMTSDMNGQTGDAAVGGLPFTASTGTFSTFPRAWGVVNGDNSWDTNLSTNNLVAQISGGASTIRPRYNSGYNTSDVQLQQIGGGNSYFGCTVTYETDS